MGFGSSKQKSVKVSGPSPIQTKASNILLEAIVPGSSLGGDVYKKGAPDLTQAGTPEALQQLREKTTTPTGTDYNESKVGYGYGQGMRESQASIGQQMYTDVLGKGTVRVPTGQSMSQEQLAAVTNTLLPSMEDMRFKTSGEQLAQGRATPEERAVIEQQERMAADPLGFAEQVRQTANEKIFEGKALELPTMPDISDYINQVYEGVGAPMKTVIDDLLQSGTSTNINASIEQASIALQTQFQGVVDAGTQEVFNRFAQSGATSGAMIAASQNVIAEAAVGFGIELAKFTQNALLQAQQDRQVAQQQVGAIFGVAEAARAADFQAEQINLETTTNVLTAQLNSYVQLIDQFLKNSQFTAGVIYDFLGKASQAEVENFRMIYEVMVGLATGGPASSYGKTTQTSRQVNLGGLLNNWQGSVGQTLLKNFGSFGEGD